MVNSSLFTRSKILIPYMYRAYVRFLVTWYQGYVLVVTPNFPFVPGSSYIPQSSSNRYQGSNPGTALRYLDVSTFVQHALPFVASDLPAQELPRRQGLFTSFVAVFC